MSDLNCDVLIVGGGTGGVAAAIAISKYGLKVILTEEYAWIGGQLTSQGVPPDEHPWIEEIGCTATYRDFRNRVRVIYEQQYPLRDGLRGTPFNPGGGFVSSLCCDPRIAHQALLNMLSEYCTSDLTILTGLTPVSAGLTKSTIKSILLKNKTSGDLTSIEASIVIDCTELGDLLPLTQTEYVVGAESRQDTGELHATEKANAKDVQGFTWCFAVAYNPSRREIIDQPEDYEFWRAYLPTFTDSPWPGRLLDWKAVDPISLSPRSFDLFAQPSRPYDSLWNYRKISSSLNLGVESDDITLVNWPQNDYFIQNIIDESGDNVRSAKKESRQLSFSLLYWLQTEALRPDGGHGYPGLYPAPGILGTADGFAMAPYIRESRRIKPLFRVTEAHVGYQMRSEGGYASSKEFEDSVGLGSYRIDLHPSPAGRNYVDISSLPFQIPLGALIPENTRNLIAGNKNIGTTHITNGCYRLHPVEWNIGEAAGHLAGFSLLKNISIHDISEHKSNRLEFQQRLMESGIELNWPAEIAGKAR
jgi:hypothetical protein